MQVMVVGGAGYVGSALVPALQERGHKVTVIDSLWFGNHLPKGTDLRNLDFFDLREDDFDGFDTVVFLGGVSNDPAADFSPCLNYMANAAGPAFLAYVAKRAGVKRFVHGGTASVYGLSDGSLLSEDAPTVTAAPYGISKLQGEYGCFHLQDDTFSVISIRKGTVCGYSPRMRFDLVINTMYRDAITKGLITVNNPDTLRPIVAIEDAVAAYVRAVEAAPDVNGKFNVVSENTTIGKIATRVSRIVPATIRVFKNPEVRSYQIDGGSGTHALGMSASGSVESIVRGIHAHRNEYGDFDEDEFYNIRVFKRLLTARVAAGSLRAGA